eukprot:TRINITY_DN40744_c0_g1_i1.p1 TRINITY_DN40744_c0_g1~~TRINITY_DN40744_c0_g1_i1.p1  ORF type:complete len:2252 (-),score=317.91 TRINITY_DN40744_c0_g1_i1:39-6794(-)
MLEMLSLQALTGKSPWLCVFFVSFALADEAGFFNSSDTEGRGLLESNELDNRWYYDERCECCESANGVPLRSLYKTEVHKTCFGGGLSKVGWHLEDVLAQTIDGTLTVRPVAQKLICASHRCRGAIATFWSAVHGCALSGYWTTIAIALSTAKSQCHFMQHTTLRGSGEWLARVRATFHGVDTDHEAAMLRVETAAEASGMDALATPPHGLPVDPSRFEVKCSSVPKYNGGLGGESNRIHRPPRLPNRTCAQVTSSWPTDLEQDVASDLSHVILHFDRCIQASDDTTLTLTVLPHYYERGLSNDLELRLRSTSDMPGRTLVFPMLSSKPLGNNRQVSMHLTGGPVVSCEDQAPVCDDFIAIFHTAETQPKVIWTDLKSDRWLRSIFDLPVKVVDDAEFKVQFRQIRRPESSGKQPEISDKLPEVLPLQSSKHMFMKVVTHEHDTTTDSLSEAPTGTMRCAYSLKADTEKPEPCDDGRIYEVDLCDHYECQGSRLPCDLEIEAIYPAGIALRFQTEVPSIKSHGKTSSRICEAPHLLPSLEWPVGDGNNLQIQWSHPVQIAGDGQNKITLCHTGTLELHCPIQGGLISGSQVTPCTGLDGDCAIWSLDAGADGRPSCGGLEVHVEAGAVQSVDDNEASLESTAQVAPATKCPTWNPTAGHTCLLLWGHNFVKSNCAVNFRDDLDRLHIQYQVETDPEHLLRRLQSGSYLPRCVLVPPLQASFVEHFKQEEHGIRSIRINRKRHRWEEAFFKYVQQGGQLYIAGSLQNVQFVSRTFRLFLSPAETGRRQVPTEPPPSPELGSTSGLPIELPVLNQMTCVKLTETTSFRDGDEVVASGLYSSGHVAPTDGSFGFGVLEVGVGNGFVEYMAFDWHSQSSAKREPWARLLQTLLKINLGRWAPPPPLPPLGRRLNADQATIDWPGRELSACPASSLAPINDEQDFECTFSYRCLESHSRSNMLDACEPARQHLTAMIGSRDTPFFARMRYRCINLQLQYFSPAIAVKLDETCPTWAAIDEVTEDMKAACGFGFGPDASVLEVEVTKTDLGVEAFSSGVRTAVCQQPFCRGQMVRLTKLFAKCPGEAGLKGERARLARMLSTTVKSCARAGGAKRNVQNHFLAKGINGISPAEQDALADAIRVALADQLDLHLGASRNVNPILALAATLAGIKIITDSVEEEGLVTVKVHPVDVVQDAWARAMGSSKPSPAPSGQDLVAYIPEGLPGGACQGCSVRNLQVVNVQPAIGSSSVSPEGAIRIFFDDVVVVDNPNAKIRIYPQALEALCQASTKTNSKEKFQYFPFDTGLGNITAASGQQYAWEHTPGIPVLAVCQEYKMSDSSVKVGDEMIQVLPRHPLMRDSKIVVRIDRWAVRAAALRGQERYQARWMGWERAPKGGDVEGEVFEFTTGAPQSEAKVSVAVGCDNIKECARAQKFLRFASSAVEERMKCFLAWYRCGRDPTSPQVCKQPSGLEWCDVMANDWRQVSQSAPPMDADAAIDSAQQLDRSIPVMGETLELRSLLQPYAQAPQWVLVVSGVAWVISCAATFRAAQWFIDIYRESREYDPFVVQTTQMFPFYIVLAFSLVPFVMALLGSIFCPSFYHFAASMQGQGAQEDEVPGQHAFKVCQAAAAFDRLKQQMLWAGIVSGNAAVAVNTLICYAVVARYRHAYFDLGQLAAVIAFGLSWTALAGGSCNWTSSTAPTLQERMLGREMRFEAAVLAISSTAVLSKIWTAVLTTAFACIVISCTEGLGCILSYYLRYRWMQLWHWRDSEGEIGKWDRWIIHIRDMQLLHGFHASVDGKWQDDGFLTIKFYTTDAPFNIISTRNIPVRALGRSGDNGAFEGDNVCVNVSSWRSVVVADVTYQASGGSQPDRVAGAMWDPWTGSLLDACFVNWQVCNPRNDRKLLWDFQVLMDSDGLPKEGHYHEFRVNMSPSNGILSLQATHLGPRQVLPERTEPTDIPLKELFLGDTYVVSESGFARREPTRVQNLPSEGPHRTEGAGAIEWISGYTAQAVGAVELKLRGDKGSARYGDPAMGTHLDPHVLQPWEWITAVQQELQEPATDKLGNALTFFTSAGAVVTFSGHSALPANRFAAARGQQIRGLQFEGHHLIAISVAPVDGEGGFEIKYHAEDKVEAVELAFRDGHHETHGRMPHGARLGKHSLAKEEYVIAVSQEVAREDHDSGGLLGGASHGQRHLGSSFAFFTSQGKVFYIKGRHSQKDYGTGYAAAAGKQVVGLRFSAGRLEGVETLAAKSWKL